MRWAALARARDEDQAALSGKVKLQQETTTDVQPGVLLFVPIYRPGMPHETVVQRRANILGWASSPLRMRDLMNSLLRAIQFDELRPVLNLALYDADGVSLAALLFALHPAPVSESPSESPSAPALQALRQVPYGHQAGDAVLRVVGELLRSALRGGDIACRYGGEELIVILPDCTLDDAWERCEDLRHAVAGLRLAHGASTLPAITVSIGLVAAQPQETDAVLLLGRADAALYQAKAQGRNRIVTFTGEAL